MARAELRDSPEVPAYIVVAGVRRAADDRDEVALPVNSHHQAVGEPEETAGPEPHCRRSTGQAELVVLPVVPDEPAGLDGLKVLGAVRERGDLPAQADISAWEAGVGEEKAVGPVLVEALPGRTVLDLDDIGVHRVHRCPAELDAGQRVGRAGRLVGVLDDERFPDGRRVRIRSGVRGCVAGVRAAVAYGPGHVGAVEAGRGWIADDVLTVVQLDHHARTAALVIVGDEGWLTDRDRLARGLGKHHLGISRIIRTARRGATGSGRSGTDRQARVAIVAPDGRAARTARPEADLELRRCSCMCGSGNAQRRHGEKRGSQQEHD